MGKGKLIAIEGVDGSGKATQAKELIKNLKEEGLKIKTIDFPQYENNFFGELIGECLVGKHIDFTKLDPKITSILFAADRFESSKKIKKWLKKGYTVVVDRYASSNQIHQGGKIQDPKKRKEFLNWLEKMEFEVFEIPRPDVIVYLDVPFEITQELLKKESGKQKKKYLKGREDVAENNLEYLKRSHESAIKIIQGSNNWINIECAKNGKLRSVSDISKEIFEKVIKVIRK